MPSLLILAAGIGSRYGGLKQMEKVGPSGETILDYSIFDAINAGFGKVVFVIRKSIEQEVKDFFFENWAKKISLDYVLQEIEKIPEGFKVPSGRKKPWGTGQAVLVAAPKITDPFAVINADDFYGRESFNIAADFLSALPKTDTGDYCIIGYKLQNTLSDFGAVSRGVCETDEHGFLKAVTETHGISQTADGITYQDENGALNALEGDAIVSMNLMGFTESIFGHIEPYFEKFLRERQQDLNTEFLLPQVLNELVNKGVTRVKVLSTNESWFGVTHKEDKQVVIEKIRELVGRGMYPENLWGL
ncbi:MAG: NDP-sugar synthase [bacterium]